VRVGALDVAGGRGDVGRAIQRRQQARATDFDSMHLQPCHCTIRAAADFHSPAGRTVCLTLCGPRVIRWRCEWMSWLG
jgi:hypothetical protein